MSLDRDLISSIKRNFADYSSVLLNEIVQSKDQDALVLGSGRGRARSPSGARGGTKPGTARCQAPRAGPSALYRPRQFSLPDWRHGSWRRGRFRHRTRTTEGLRRQFCKSGPAGFLRLRDGMAGAGYHGYRSGGGRARTTRAAGRNLGGRSEGGAPCGRLCDAAVGGLDVGCEYRSLSTESCGDFC